MATKNKNLWKKKSNKVKSIGKEWYNNGSNNVIYAHTKPIKKIFKKGILLSLYVLLFIEKERG